MLGYVCKGRRRRGCIFLTVNFHNMSKKSNKFLELLFTIEF